jgi:hypothetical protein
MPQQIKSLAIAFSIFIAFFISIRYVLLPKSFGELGHYRKDALNEIGALPIKYTGAESCKKCHEDKINTKSLGFHKGLECELCHGPAYNHVTYADTIGGKPLVDSLKLPKTADRAFCSVCHMINKARIKMKNDTINQSVIHQIDIKKHNLLDDNKKELACIECHNPHDP